MKKRWSAFLLVIIFLVSFVSFSQSAGDIKVYPNPFKSKLGHTKITFDNISVNSTIRIYTATGKLVWEDKILNIPYDWHANNLSSQQVATGIYFYIVTGDGGEVFKGKIAIVR